MSFLTAILGDFLPYIIAGVAAFAGIFVYGKTQKNAGKREAELDSRRETDKRTKEARDAAEQTRKDVADSDGSDLDQRLRDRGL